jgi:hypothetical protein
MEREPMPGDIIWADRREQGKPYLHCGIYEGGGYVIHFAAPNDSETEAENAVVHEVPFERFKNGCTVKVIDIKEGGGYSAEETIRRAKSLLGTKGYDISTFNCEHFATWCKTGEYRSIQVDGVKNLIEKIGGPVGKIACEVHDIAQMFKAARLDDVYSSHENEINDKIETNAMITETIPPAPSEERANYADFKIVDEAEPATETEAEYHEKEDDEDAPPPPPAKKAWYEKVGNVAKTLTYPVSIALEFLKRTGRLPIPKGINFPHLGAKVRNVIDNIVTSIKVFTGRLTKAEAVEERMNNEAALAGTIIQQKHEQPVAERLKQVFGKVGSVVKHIVQQTVTQIVPQSVRKAVKIGSRIIGKTISNGITSFVQKAKEGVKTFFGKIKQKLVG